MARAARLSRAREPKRTHDHRADGATLRLSQKALSLRAFLLSLGLFSAGSDGAANERKGWDEPVLRACSGVVLFAAAMVAVGCGSSTPQVASLGGRVTTAAAINPAVAGLLWDRCMRGHGIPEADPGRVNPPIDQNSPQFQRAYTACRAYRVARKALLRRSGRRSRSGRTGLGGRAVSAHMGIRCRILGSTPRDRST